MRTKLEVPAEYREQFAEAVWDRFQGALERVEGEACDLRRSRELPREEVLRWQFDIASALRHVAEQAPKGTAPSHYEGEPTALVQVLRGLLHPTGERLLSEADPADPIPLDLPELGRIIALAKWCVGAMSDLEEAGGELVDFPAQRVMEEAAA